MTNPLDQGSPMSTPPAPTPAPTLEPAEPGTSAPAEAVAREGTAPASSRSRSGVRWAIALIGVALVIGVSAAIVALAAGRPNPSIAVGYMPDDVVQYSEYRLDLPGDQRQKLAGFLSAFPGFDDQAAIQTKLNETFDRLVAAVSNDEQTYTSDIEPWFGGQIAMGSGPPALPDGDAGPTIGGAQPLVVVSIKDRALTAEWIESIGAPELDRGDYNGAILFTPASGGYGGSYAIAVNDEVMLAGTADMVRAAVDSGGDGALASDPEFKAAFGVATKDYVTFSFVDYRAMVESYVDLIGARADLAATSIDEEVLSLVPAWAGAVGRFENDALVSDAMYPAVDIGFDGSNKKSTLLGMAPPGTIAYAETHDAGKALTALVDRFRKEPEVDQALDQAEQTIGMELPEIFGWWGDAAVVVAQDDAGQLGGGLLIAPTDAAAADRLFDVLRGLVVLGGGSAGLEVRDVEHGDATITVVDFSEAAGASVEELPAGYKAEIAYAVTDDVVVIGYGQAFVESVLDAGPGPSLADDARVNNLVKRVGEENLAFTFVDVRAIRELVEPLARESASPETWANYETEIKPFLLPFDAFASSLREDGDVNRAPSVTTVTKP